MYMKKLLTSLNVCISLMICNLMSSYRLGLLPGARPKPLLARITMPEAHEVGILVGYRLKLMRDACVIATSKKFFALNFLKNLHVHDGCLVNIFPCA